MINEIVGPGRGRPERSSRSGSARPSGLESAAKASGSEDSPEVTVSSELQGLIERVKEAETFRKERVHQVLEKMRRGELIVSETVREAAEKILREGP